MSPPPYDVELDRYHDELATSRGPARIANVRQLARRLLDRVEAADITHDDAANALRTIIAGLADDYL